MSFAGHSVLSLESRRCAEMSQLIRANGGDPFVAPSMRELPLEHNAEAFAFADRLFAAAFDMVIFLTGVGARALAQAITMRHPPERLPEALRRVAVVARGPKPMAVLREWNVPVAVLVPEPNTWRELLAAIADRPESRIAVQEYGKSNADLLAGLRARPSQVIPVPVYRWDLPLDAAPLREAVHRLAAGQFDFLFITTSIQVTHLLRIADEEGVADAARRRLREIVVASIGPTSTETLLEHGIPVDFTPSHPKMGYLVRETADRAADLLRRKRGA